MKPSFPVIANIKISRSEIDHSIARSEVGYTGQGTQITLSYPFWITVWTFLLLLPTGTASSQTTLIAVKDSQSVVLAADSKASSAAPFCKIRRCGNAYLAVSGSVEVTTKEKQLQLWPALLDACKGEAEPRKRVVLLELAGLSWLNGAINLARQTLTIEAYDKVKREMLISFVLVGWKETGYIFVRGIGNTSNRYRGSAGAVLTDLRYDYDFPLTENEVAHIFLGHYEGDREICWDFAAVC